MKKIMCWLGWHRWNSLTAWPWQQFCTRCGVGPPDAPPHWEWEPESSLVNWVYQPTRRPSNPHYHCSTLDRTPCPTGEHRNPATAAPITDPDV